MEQIFEPYDISDTPPPSNGIQVNFCKTPGCPNYGVPSIITKRPRGRPPKTAPFRKGYTLFSGDIFPKFIVSQFLLFSFFLTNTRGTRMPIGKDRPENP